MYFSSKSIIVIIAFSLVLVTCKKDNRCDCMKSTGNTTIEYRTLPAFDKINVDDNVNVIISNDSQETIKVEAGKNLVSLITTEVIDNELFIRNKNRCNWVRSYKKEINVYVKMPKLIFLTTKGSGDITTTDTIYGTSLGLLLHGAGNVSLIVKMNIVAGELFGSGDFTIKGKADNWQCKMGGNGFLYASEMQAGYTWIWSNTTGNAYVYAPDWLRIFIYGSGDIYYSGNPSTIEKTIQGTGNLYKQ